MPATEYAVAPSRRRTASPPWPPPVYASARARARVTRASSAVRLFLIVDGVNPYGHASMRLCSRVSSVGGSSGRGVCRSSALAFSARTAPIIGRTRVSSTTNRPTPLLGGGWAAFLCRSSFTSLIRPRSVCGDEGARRTVAAVLGAADGRRAPTRPCASPLSTRRPPAPSTARAARPHRSRGQRLRAAANGRRAAARAEAAQLAQLRRPPRSQLEAQLEAQLRQLAPAPAADSARGPRE